MMVFVTRNVTHSLVAGTAVIALLRRTPGLVVPTLAAGVSSTTANVMSRATTLSVCMIILTAETRRKFASEYTFTLNRIPPYFFLY